jgi:glutamyl-tRNA reductase
VTRSRPVAEGAPRGEQRADETAADRLARRTAAVRDEQLDDALDRLDAHGELSAAQRETVARLATGLTARIVGPTVERLRRTDDPRTVATARRVFDPRG